MICGTGFMLYQNKKLTASGPANENVPIAFDNFSPAISETAPGDAGAETIEPDKSAAAGLDQASAINKINQNGGFNLDIFLSDKFKNLSAGAPLTKEPPEVGKRDPFKAN